MSRWGGLGMYWLQEGEKYWRFSNRLWLRTIELRSDDNWSDFLLTFLSCVRGSASLTESCQPNLLWKLQQEPKIQNTICSELWALSAATPYSDNCQSGAALIISCSAVINTLGSSPSPLKWCPAQSVFTCSLMSSLCHVDQHQVKVSQTAHNHIKLYQLSYSITIKSHLICLLL